jgi:phosphatidylglycerophosphate synthase
MSRYEQIPLVRSIEETAEAWPDMSARQKFGAGVASIITIAGPVGRIITEAHQGHEQSATPGELVAGIAIDARDSLDGKVARHFGGVTPFGKELDPLVDKLDFLIQEFFEYNRGNLPLGHLVLRASRDALVTALRSHVMAITDGQANVGANWYGKFSTGLRQASLRATGLPFERDLPYVRTIHQTAATGLLVASGAANIKQLLDERAKYLPKG